MAHLYWNHFPYHLTKLTMNKKRYFIETKIDDAKQKLRNLSKQFALNVSDKEIDDLLVTLDYLYLPSEKWDSNKIGASFRKVFKRLKKLNKKVIL